MNKLVFILVLIFNSLIFSQKLFFDNETNFKLKDEIVAEVGNIKISAEEFIYSYEFGPAFPKKHPDSKLKHLNYMINEKLLAIEGFEKNIIGKELPSNIYNDIRNDLSTEEMFVEEILPEVRINNDEIEKVINKKQSEYQLRWLYTNSSNVLENYVKSLNNGITFDSLFYAQLNDSVFIDDRQLISTLFNIYKKNPVLAQIVDTLEPGKTSNPIHTDDGWYIIFTDNIFKNVITNETDYNKLKTESVNAIKKSKMDILSDQFVKKLFEESNPIIKRDAFNILRSFLGKYIIDSEKYSSWDLDNKVDIALNNIGLKKGDKFSGLALVENSVSLITIDEFVKWYRLREQYVKFNKADLISLSKSLEDLVWQMVRDKLLTYRAKQSGYDKSEWVTKQSDWWMEKISYSSYKNELATSITLNSDEIKFVDENGKSQTEFLNEKFNQKLLSKILGLKKKNKITINKNILDELIVSSENDASAIDMYIVKRGNLIPRPAYPTIDNEWASWE